MYKNPAFFDPSSGKHKDNPGFAISLKTNTWAQLYVNLFIATKISNCLFFRVEFQHRSKKKK